MSLLKGSNLQIRRDYLKCVLMYKSLHDLASTYLLSDFIHAREVYNYPTTHRDLIRLPFSKTVRKFWIKRCENLQCSTPEYQKFVSIETFKRSTKCHVKSLWCYSFICNLLTAFQQYFL